MKRLFQGWSWEHWYNLAREDIDAAYASVARAARVGVYCGLALWVLSGFHAVRQDEVGVKTVCGHVVRGVEQPGLRYRLPWPVGSVQRVKVQRQQRVTIGIPKEGISSDERQGKVAQKALDSTVAKEFEADTETKGSKLEDLIKAGQKKQLQEGARVQMGSGLPLLTADHNVTLVQAVVQYIIREPKQFIYTSEGAELMLVRAASSALLEEAAKAGVDDLLTTARTDVQTRVREAINDQLKPFNLGVQVAGVELQRVTPPEAVAASFRAVNTAREEMNTIVNEANQYAGTVVPEAQGQADKLTSEAEAFLSTRVAEARGDAARFEGVFREYQATGRLTGERLRFETVERVLARAKRVQVGGTSDSPLDVTIIPPAPGADQ